MEEKKEKLKKIQKYFIDLTKIIGILLGILIYEFICGILNVLVCYIKNQIKSKGDILGYFLAGTFWGFFFGIIIAVFVMFFGLFGIFIYDSIRKYNEMELLRMEIYQNNNDQ